jgi:hypothetical protein
MNEKKALPDNHKRSLSVTARHIEQGIREIELLLLNNNPDNATSTKESLTSVIKNLNNEERASILDLIKYLKIENEKMIKDLNLPKEKLYEDRIVRGRLSHIWALLVDSTPKGLKGYGELNSNQAEVLDSYINKLLDIVYKLQAIIK